MLAANVRCSATQGEARLRSLEARAGRSTDDVNAGDQPIEVMVMELGKEQ
jgi:hypothetical protein